MTFKQILTAAAASAILAIGSAGAASAVEYDANHKVIVKKEVIVKRPIIVKRPVVRVVNPNTYRVVRPVARPFIVKERVYQIMRGKRYRVIGAPYIYAGKYMVRGYDYRGRKVLVTLDPYTGAWIAVRFIR